MRSACVWSIIRHCVIRPALAAACLITALAASPSPAQARCVVAAVNGEAITNDDVEQRRKFNLLANRKSLPRKDIIEELIDDKLKVQVARRYRIDITEKDVDQQYDDLAKRMHLSREQLTQALNQGGVDAASLKAKILADMSWRYIVRGKFWNTLQFVEKSVEADAEGQKKGAETEVYYDYTLRPILFLARRGNAPLLEARRQDADALRTRFTSCEAGLADARAQQDVIIREPITKNSADLSPPLRDLLNKTELGHLTPPETTPQGVELFAVCGKKETKPLEQRIAREQLFESKFEALSKAYLHELRRSAKVEFMQRCRPHMSLTRRTERHDRDRRPAAAA